MKLLLAISFLCFTNMIWAHVNQNNDVQVWVAADFQKKISPKSSFDVSNEYRFGDNLTELYFIYLQGIYSYQFHECLKIEPGYRQIWRKILNGKDWGLIYEPLCNFTIQRSGKWDIRQRISYQFTEKAPNRWLYRARIRWLGRGSFYGHQLNPYISNEIFVFSRGGLAQDRLLLGIMPQLYRWLNGDFYYMFRYFKDFGWDHHHIFGIKLTAKF